MGGQSPPISNFFLLLLSFYKSKTCQGNSGHIFSKIALCSFRHFPVILYVNMYYLPNKLFLLYFYFYFTLLYTLLGQVPYVKQKVPCIVFRDKNKSEILRSLTPYKQHDYIHAGSKMRLFVQDLW